MNNQFKETKIMFENAIPVNFPISYEVWISLKDDIKAAALYVNFYDQITLAWQKAKSDFTPDEDGVSTLMQYLMKNVPIIVNDEKKYKPSYIYRVAYNCMGCLRRVKREIDHYNLTTSNYTSDCNGEEIDIFATMIGEDSDVLETTYKRRFDMEIQHIIDSLDDNSIKVIEYLLGGNKLGKRAESEKEKITSELRVKFDKYRMAYCNSKADDTLRFSKVLEIDDNVSSAVVEMSDGVKAVYYGETTISPSGRIKVVFFGPQGDYIVPINIAKKFKVLNVELY